MYYNVTRLDLLITCVQKISVHFEFAKRTRALNPVPCEQSVLDAPIRPSLEHTKGKFFCTPTQCASWTSGELRWAFRYKPPPETHKVVFLYVESLCRRD
jgi:hypothetical protein